MSSAIYYRLAGQGVALTLHAGNSLVMLLAMQNEDLMKDQDIKNMTSMQSRYLTVWNIGFQLLYFALAFTCDFLTVTGRDTLIPKSLRRFRQAFFSSIVFPVAASIFAVFWPFFIINRELLFPKFIDKIFSFKSNLVMHFFIVVSALWELVFLPRSVPKTHALNIGSLLFLFILYNSVLIHTYLQRGFFPYPILNMMYGSVYYVIFVVTLLFIGISTYLIQWKLTALLWGQEKKDHGKVKFS